jgi:hypothetical protein
LPYSLRGEVAAVTLAGAENALSRPDRDDEASEELLLLLLPPWGKRNRVPLEKRTQPPRCGVDRLLLMDRLESSIPVHEFRHMKAMRVGLWSAIAWKVLNVQDDVVASRSVILNCLACKVFGWLTIPIAARFSLYTGTLTMRPLLRHCTSSIPCIHPYLHTSC